MAASASLVMSPMTTTTYHLVATVTGGTMNANVTVEVLPAQDDILWRHSSGTTHIWLMNGTAIMGGGGVATLDPAWQIVGTGDYNGDGQPDLLWRHSDGTTVMWLMNGTQIIGGGGVTTIDPTWQVVGAGDYNGDGHADILWRHSSGTIVIWLMNGARSSSEDRSPRSIPPGRSSGRGDYNGDGRADILWRHSSGTDRDVVHERNPDHRRRAGRHDRSRLADRRVGGLQRRRPTPTSCGGRTVPGPPICG